MTFQKLGINEHILKAITALGFDKPTPIQQQSIPILLKGETDYVGLAQTGTGKTAAFGLPLINSIDPNKHNTIQALILCPTRELCLQISKELQNYAKYTADIKIVAVYGGVDISKQIRALKKGVHIVVGTPGRLLDHIRRNSIKLQTVKTVVLDEADEMLNMGFQEDIDTILLQTTQEKKIWLFSATMPHRVEKITTNYMTNPFKVTIGSKNSAAQNINHQYCVVKRSDKYNALRRFIDSLPSFFGILFCRTRRDVKDVVQKLMEHGYDADALHGDLSQYQRDLVMNKFRHKQIQLLVATDVASRGIDVDDVTHVIHYALPEDIENYTHRSGRTARAGKSGISISIVTPREVGTIKRIEKQIGKKINYTTVPSGTDIGQQQLMNFIKTISEVEVKDDIKDYVDIVVEKLDGISKQDLIAKFISIKFDDFLQKYKKAPNLNANVTGNASTSYNIGSEQRVFINLGVKDGLDKGKFVRLVCDSSSINSGSIGKIILNDTFSIFYVDGMSTAQTIIKALNSIRFNNRKIVVELSDSKRSQKSRFKKRKR